MALLRHYTEHSCIHPHAALRSLPFLTMPPVAFATKYEISALPSFLFFHNGKLVKRFEGASEGKLRAHVEELAAL